MLHASPQLLEGLKSSPTMPRRPEGFYEGGERVGWMIHGQGGSWGVLLVKSSVELRGARNAPCLPPAARGLEIQSHHAKVSRGFI
jgi:hypothetical protein